MKKIFLILLLGALVFGGAIFIAVQFIALPKIEKIIASQIENLGYKNTKIENLSIAPYGFKINKIIFGEDEFNTATNIRAAVSWPAFIASSRINRLTIEQINLSSITDNFSDILSYKNQFDLAKISDFQTDNIQVKKAIWDSSTPQGALRIEGAITIRKTDDDNYKIQAHVGAKQHQLTFYSLWEGLIDNARNVQMDGKFEDFHLNYGPLQINRGSGWLTYQGQDGSSSISGQLEAGSGKIFSIPAGNIALVIGQEEDYYPILFRADASGIDHVRFTTDIHYSRDVEKEVFNSSLKIDDLQKFITHLHAQNLISADKMKQVTMDGAIDMSLAYLPEKRFPDGPAPFDLIVTHNGADSLKGTFLLYTDSLDLRGTAQSDKAMIKILKAFSFAKEENISEDTIRFDGNISPVLEKEYQ